MIAGVANRSGLRRPARSTRLAPARAVPANGAAFLAIEYFEFEGSGGGAGGDPIDIGRPIAHPARDASRRRQHRRPVAAAAREGPLDLMRRAREGANHLI
jgi:hypothetical protein